MNDPDTLRKVLRRVPSKFLKNELNRRKSAAGLITEDQTKEFHRLLHTVAELTAIHHSVIMGDSRDNPHVKARWELYSRLFEAGWKPAEISAITGHHSARVYNGLRKRKLVPPRKVKC